MLTQTEMNKLFSQINSAFDEDRKRIAALEAKIKEFESVKRAEKAPQAGKGVEK